MINTLRWGGVSHFRDYASPQKTASLLRASLAATCSTAPNDAGTCQSDWHKSDTAPFASVHGGQPPGTTKNAARAATRHGVSKAHSDWDHCHNECPTEAVKASRWVRLAELTAADLARLTAEA